MLKNVFFDLDGTLTDSREGITRCIQYSLANLGRPSLSNIELQSYIGPPLRASFMQLLGSGDEALIEKAVSLYRERFSKTGIFENLLYPGVVDLLSTLNRGPIKVYLVTSKPKYYAEIIIKHFQLTQWFQDIYGSEMDGRFGNKADLVKLLLSNRNIGPGEAVMVGDRKEDIIAGKANGTKTIGVTYGFGSEQEITDSAPDYICNNPLEIQNVVLGGEEK
jgi:phosphoglycolate phosphatase